VRRIGIRVKKSDLTNFAMVFEGRLAERPGTKVKSRLCNDLWIRRECA
jgi:hypothetical protein